MTSKAPIPAFCSSDEEDEDKEALLYLPIAPEIEDPEDNWVPVSEFMLKTTVFLFCMIGYR